MFRLAFHDCIHNDNKCCKNITLFRRYQLHNQELINGKSMTLWPRSGYNVATVFEVLSNFFTIQNKSSSIYYHIVNYLTSQQKIYIQTVHQIPSSYMGAPFTLVAPNLIDLGKQSLFRKSYKLTPNFFTYYVAIIKKLNISTHSRRI